MEIPKRFKIANHEYNIIVQDYVYDCNGEQLYGYHDPVKLEIRIATKMKRGEEVIDLNEEQIANTFWHELFHAFNFFWDNGGDESLAQTFANFMREYDSTKKFK